jgi:hypothetical protein
VSTDPDNHRIRYRVQWDDGTEDETDLVQNGTTVTLSHSWSEIGDKDITARAYDEYDKPSDNWSIHTFTVPRNKVLNLHLLELLFAKFPNVFPILQKLLGL